MVDPYNLPIYVFSTTD